MHQSLRSFRGHGPGIEVAFSVNDAVDKIGVNARMSASRTDHLFKRLVIERLVIERPVIERLVIERPVIERPAIERQTVERLGGRRRGRGPRW